MSDKMREEFEEAYVNYCVKHGWKAHTAFHMISEVYVKASTELAWQMWKESRESMVIELPSDQCIDIHGFSPKATKLYCRKAIEAAGLKVKP